MNRRARLSSPAFVDLAIDRDPRTDAMPLPLEKVRMFAAAPSIVLLASLAILVQDPRAIPTTATPVDLRCQFPAGKAIEVTLQTNVKGALELKLPREQRSVQVAQSRSERMLDQMLSLDSETNASEQRRTWLEARATANGATEDPAWTGLAVTYVSDGTKQSATLGGRMLPKAQTDGILRQSEFVGLWLGLPEAAVAGTRYPVDAEAMIQTMFATEGAPKVGEAWVTLDRVEAETSLAHLTMHLEFCDAVAANDGMTADLAFVVEVDAELNLGERRLTKLTSSGTVTFTGTGRFEGMVGGTLRVTSTVTSKVVGDPKAAVATTAKFRDNAYAFEESGFKCALPAYWARLPRKDAKTIAQFFDSRDDQQTLIQFLDLKEAGDPTTDAYIDSFSKGVMKSGFLDPKFKKSKTALGKAITYAAALKDDRRVVGLLTVSGPSRKLSIQLIGRTEATARAEKDFQDLVASLKPAK